jgi:hypothetical protein
VIASTASPMVGYGSVICRPAVPTLPIAGSRRRCRTGRVRASACRSSRCSSEYRRVAERLCAERARSPGPLRPAYSFGRPSPCATMSVKSFCICWAP